MPVASLSPYQAHVAKWGDCRACELCRTRNKIVLCKGKLPCDCLLIGEAPGASEDVVGLPFVGPAGRLLDEMVSAALDDSDNPPLRLAYTNLVCCIPKDGTTLRKKGEPSKKEMEACYPRLEQFITKVAKPKLIICVGELAKKQAALHGWVKLVSSPARVVHVLHPSYILQQPIVSKPLAIQRTIVNLVDAFQLLS